MELKTNEAIAAKVRGILAENNLKQQNVAGVLHLSRMAVSRRLSGETPFGAHELLALAEALNVPISRFFPERVADRVLERSAA